VTGEERDGPPADVSNGEGPGRGAEGRVQVDLFRVVEEPVEARSADDGYIGRVAQDAAAVDEEDEEDDEVEAALSGFDSGLLSDLGAPLSVPVLPVEEDEVVERLSVL
jgi:hypothetical protein